MKPPNTESSIPDQEDPERPLRLALGYALLLGLPLLVVLLVMATKFQGLGSSIAWDHAQLARHLSAGDGFVTSVIRPLSVGVKPTVQNHPDLYNAPIHPLTLALFFSVLHPSDKVAAFAGLLFWVASIWLTFLIARRWFGVRAATLATVFCAGNVVALTAAVGGLPCPVLTVFVLLTIWAAVEGCLEEQLSTAHVIVAGLGSAVVLLTDFTAGVLAIVVCAYLMVSRKRKLRTIALFGISFLATLGPWFYLNARQGTAPLFGLAWYNAGLNTRNFPGDAIWGLLSPPNPLRWFLGHPGELFGKLVSGLGQFLEAAPRAMNPVVAILFLAAIPIASQQARSRILMALSLVSLGASVLVACLNQPSPELLAAWAPLLSILAGMAVGKWIGQLSGHLSLDWFRITPRQSNWIGRNSALARLLGSRHWGRTAAYGVVLAGVLAPLFSYLFLTRPTPVMARQTDFLKLQQSVPKDELVMTDQPALVAWYTDRNALGMLQRETDWDRLATNGVAPAAIFIRADTPVVANSDSDWWSWLTSPRGIYRGLSPVAAIAPGTILRIRPATSPPDKRALELEQVMAEVRQNPDSAEAQVRLGSELLAHDRLQDAAEAFQRAAALDVENPEAVLGSWQVTSRLHDTGNVLALAQRALQTMGPRSRDPVILQDVTGLLNRYLTTRPNDPWLLLMAALCRVRLEDWPAARDYCQQVERLAPKALPARSLLGSLYLQQQMIVEAAAEVEPLAAENPRNAAIQELLGKVRLRQGRLEDALQAFQRARQLRPNRLMPHLEAGFTLLKLSRPAESVTYFESALALAPQSVLSRVGLAEALTMQGRRKEAIAIYEKLLGEYPRELLILNNLANLFSGDDSTLEQAVRLGKQAVTMFPQNAGARDTLGWVYYRLGRYEDAVEQLQEARRLAPNTALIEYHIGKAFLAVDQRENALGALRNAVARGLPPDEQEDAQKLLARP